MRALAHWGDAPLATMPDVPSLKSLGYDASFVQWSAVFVPAETPEDIVKRLAQSVRHVAQDPKIQQQILNTGSPIQYMDAETFTKYWAQDDANLVKAVRAIGKVE
jgi:tripartite-type tricarboxylate transporter receptor subunit TctC